MAKLKPAEYSDFVELKPMPPVIFDADKLMLFCDCSANRRVSCKDVVVSASASSTVWVIEIASLEFQ